MQCAYHIPHLCRMSPHNSTPGLLRTTVLKSMLFSFIFCTNYFAVSELFQKKKLICHPNDDDDDDVVWPLISSGVFHPEHKVTVSISISIVVKKVAGMIISMFHCLSLCACVCMCAPPYSNDTLSHKVNSGFDSEMVPGQVLTRFVPYVRASISMSPMRVRGFWLYDSMGFIFFSRFG